MSYFDGVGPIGAIIILGVASSAIWAAICGLARLADRAVPDLARRMARRATQIIPEASRDLYNFESDVHEALQNRHRYSAFGTALGSLVRVAPSVAVREKRRPEVRSFVVEAAAGAVLDAVYSAVAVAVFVAVYSAVFCFVFGDTFGDYSAVYRSACGGGIFFYFVGAGVVVGSLHRWSRHQTSPE